RDGAEIGMVELDLRTDGEVEIVYFGLVKEAVGQGLGRLVMAKALQAAWRPGIARVWLHTCTHDHPGALKFYTSCGFTPYA
ncbi:GNAT family N-acetyltransferase, partial [Stenotrophomonas maltophilia]|uniref:GNAT family N-acetyltransferase n=1 Tax=Stenotrophomonas maltophilia TaxID=40324 RepID=UPI0013DCDBA8